MKNHLRIVWTGILLLGVGFAVGEALPKPIPGLQVGRGVGKWRSSGTPTAPLQLALVYLGSSVCGPANNPKLKVALRRAVDQVSRRTEALSMAFTTIGVAEDLDVRAGIEHLESFSVFDEILVGNGSFNSGVLRWIYQEIPGRAATPQVVLVLREVTSAPSPGIQNPRLIARIIGVEEITSWARRGSVLPRLNVFSGL